ncbi:MAG TPA: hypothetical protein VND21_09775 [Planctomycetota bacterium]|nr:hypothetical protein [Planctomycetota bacterium]
MRMYAWVAPMVLVVTAAAVAKADDDRPAPSARPQPPPRVVASPVVATPRAISIGERPPSDPAAIGSPVAQALRPVEVPATSSRACNATCPVMVGMPVDPACTATWRGRRVAFCDVDARNLWEADPGTFASNLPPTLSETPIRAPFPGAKLAAAQARALPLAAGASATPLAAGASALPAAPAAAKKTSAPTTGAPSSGSVPLAPTPEPKVVKVTAQPAHGSPSAPGGDLFGDDEDCECKDGSCRLPLPPR